MKKLFIYYSYSGNGDVVADYLKKKGFELRKVIPKKSISNNKVLGILTGGFKASINYCDKLIDFDNDVSEYNEVYIGSPIWNSRFSSPINTVLKSLELENNKITFVFYSGSGTSPKATEKVKKIFPNAKIIDLKEPKKNKEELTKLK